MLTNVPKKATSQVLEISAVHNLKVKRCNGFPNPELHPDVVIVGRVPAGLPVEDLIDTTIDAQSVHHSVHRHEC